MTVATSTNPPRVSVSAAQRRARPLTSGVIAAVLVTLALVCQVSVFSHISWGGVVPNLVLLSVLGSALARGPQFGMVLGFAAGVLIDLAPPADHIAGRWALALLVVGYVAGRFGENFRPTVPALVAAAAASSFVGTSIFALTGVMLSDPLLSVSDLISVIGVALVWDIVVSPIVLPFVLRIFARLEPDRATT